MMNADGADSDPNSRSSTPLRSVSNSDTGAPVIVKITPLDNKSLRRSKKGLTKDGEPVDNNKSSIDLDSAKESFIEDAAPVLVVNEKPSVESDLELVKESFIEDAAPVPMANMKSCVEVETAGALDKQSVTTESFSEDSAPPHVTEVGGGKPKRPLPVDTTIVLHADSSVPPAPRAVALAAEISPTNTHNTYNTYVTHKTHDSTGSQSQAVQKIEVVTREKKAKSSPRSVALLCGMKKPVLCVCALIIIGILLTNFLGWFQIPGVDEQITRLTKEITDLDNEVGRLTSIVQEIETENDRYEVLNRDLDREVDDLGTISKDLNSTVKDLVQTNSDLEESSLQLEAEIQTLTVTSAQLRSVEADLRTEVDAATATATALGERVDELEGITANLTGSEAQLNATLRGLQQVQRDLVESREQLEASNRGLDDSIVEYRGLNEDLVDRERVLRWNSGNLTVQVDGLTEEIDRLSQVEDNLNGMIEDLRTNSSDLNATLIRVNEQVVNVTDEVQRLNDLNNDINIVLQFVTESTSVTGETLNVFIDWIVNDNARKEKDLNGSYNLLVDRYASLFNDQIQNWYCTYEYEFAGDDWANEANWGTVNIDDTQLASVIQYVEKRILRPHCLDTADFRAYLEKYMVASQINTDQLIKAVGTYTNQSNAKGYYYSGNHVTVDDWIKADFSCYNLVNNYRHIVQNANIFDN